MYREELFIIRMDFFQIYRTVWNCQKYIINLFCVIICKKTMRKVIEKSETKIDDFNNKKDEFFKKKYMD